MRRVPVDGAHGALAVLVGELDQIHANLLASAQTLSRNRPRWASLKSMIYDRQREEIIAELTSIGS
jgi:hypothetical protein